MASFKDKTGREWLVEMNVLSLERIRARGIDVMALAEGEPPLATRMATDPLLVCNILRAMLRPQLEAKGISEDAFAESMGGDNVVESYDALCQELIDFFQKLGRSDLAQTIKTGNRAVGAAVLAVDKKIQAFDIEKLIDETLGRLSTSSPESLASTPAPSPGES